MTVNDFLAGSVAGAAGIFFGYPLDTVKTRLQTSSSYSGIIQCVGKVLKTEGVLGMYKGVTAPCLFAGIQHSLLFAGYATTLHLMHPGEAHVEARKDLPLAEIMFASFIGSIPQLIPSIPVEAVKTRLQFQTEGYASASARFHGPWDCARKMWKAEGIRAVYRGGNVMAVRDCFGNLFYLPVYETLHRFLKNRGSNTTAAQLIAGGCAVIKSRIQIADTPRSTLAVGREILAAEGWRAFYKGGLSMVLRGFPVNAIIFLVYEQCLLFMEKEKTAN
ncbi:unnamed protein product, partial [Mesorhabditis spiculigera]